METKKIYEVMPIIMKEIGSIGKDRKNTQQNYSFRGIDDVYNAVNASLAKNGVFCVPEVLSEKREERQTQKGGTLIYTVLSIKYTFYASDGSSISATLIGEAMDTGDKSANKAMSTAQKYAFFQIFCIPTAEQKDTEYETHEVAPKTKIFDEYLAEIKGSLNLDHLKQTWEAITISKKHGEITQEQFIILETEKNKAKGMLK